MSFTQYTAAALLNAMFGNTSSFGALASAPTIYVGLSSTAPAEDGTNVTEPSTGSYARVATTGASWADATAADPSVISNATAITFAAATGDWLAGADLTHVVIYDAATGGNLLGSGALSVAKPILSGDTASFAIGEIDISLD